ncbi:MAG: hypothetical protein OXF27_13270 [Acidobacteria bacterium]|nr:hypothetical protein [Acidobacteriota bacterium]
MAENARAIDGLRETVVAGFKAMERRFEAIDRRFEAIDRRFEAIDQRFETIDQRFGAIDRRFEAVDRRFEAIDQKMDRQFLWVVGIQITTMLAVVAAMGGIAAVALGR